MQRRILLGAIVVGFMMALLAIPFMSPPALASSNKHVDEAVQHAKEAVEHGKQGHADVLVKHAEVALKHAEMAQKETPKDPHIAEGVKGLKGAV
ncbi:MAG TPA: small metal-binding protein SmbP, partial [Nitrospiraceae bacterium]|nr:small metal-binding protein SmbP [Nitrospiraceae bacterium]